MSRGAERQTDAMMLTAAEVALTLLTLAAVASFARVFVDNSWVAPLVTATLVAHLTVALMRRLHRGLLLTGIVGLVVMSLQITWTHYRETATAGLPTGRTRDALDIDVTAAWNLFSDVKAPAEVAVGFVVMATVAIWVIAYLADWAAFRLWSSVETVLPSFAMFVFIAFFGTDDRQYVYAALFLAAVLAFQLLHRVLRQSHELRWLAGTQRSGTRSLVGLGGAVAVIAVLGAAALGPSFPGADQEAIIDLDPQSNGPDTRVVLSPIVDIRGRLVEQADVEAFTVRSPQPSYWRLASLDRFDGQIWGADNKYSKASGNLPDDFATDDVGTELITQRFNINALGAVWLPAAYEPRRLADSSEGNISYEPVSGTLIVGRELESSNGIEYSIESALPRFDPRALAAAPNAYPQEILDRYLGLPDDFSPRATGLAFELAGDKPNDYEKALALQEYFRAFDYNVDVGTGHSSNRIDEFLDAREGYCEQFAGSFAAMARALGIPSRVAVGFTWGDVDPNDPELYRVRGEHAHAWPEVYIPGSGWVPFEPTPTRGAPGANGWTNVAAEQAGPTADETETVPTPAPTTGVDPRADDELPPDVGSDTGGSAANSGDDGTPGWLGTAGWVLAGLAAIAIAYTVLMSILKRNRSSRRVRAAEDNRGRVEALWTDAAEALRPLGIERQAAETVAEFSKRAGDQSPPTSAGLRALGTLAVKAKYGATTPPDPAVDQAVEYRDQVRQAVDQLTTPTQRWRELLDPRPLLHRRR